MAQDDAFERFAEVDTLLRRALDEPPERRRSFLSDACGGDAALEQAALRLLEASQEQGTPLDEGALTERVAHAVALDARLPPGTRLGRYEIEAFLDAGGMGEVYRARDHTLGRDVALKVLPAELGDDPSRLSRFEREAHLLAALNHPNVATIHALERSGDVHFLVLELVPGRSLAERLRDGPLPVARVLELASQVAEGIEAAHAAGIAHGDVKPANIVVTPDGRPKLLDLGLAELRSADDRSGADPDPAAPVVGSARYLSPERWAGGPVDFHADVWAFGCTLYEMLVGAPAFPGDTRQQIREAILARAPDLGACPADTPDALRELLRRCLARDPAERLAEMAEARRAIEACIEARRTSLRAVLARRPVVPALLVLALAIGAGGVWHWRAAVAERVWALEEALPEIERRLDADDYQGVHELVARAKSILGDNAQLEHALLESSGALEVLTDPPGAEVAFQAYEAFGGEWRPLGVTPLRVARFPRGTFRFRIERSGYTPLEVPYTVALAGYVEALTESGLRPADDPSTRLAFHLEPQATPNDGMLAVEGGRYDPVPLTGFSYGGGAVIPRFSIDRAEVSNRDFQAFVDAGGYRRPELWPQPEDGPESFGAMVEGFHDRSGRAGPGGWIGGRFPEGSGALPVAGVSWFEATAYCAFRGKQLPTLFHWARAAFPSWDTGAPLSPAMARHANFSQKGPAPAGAYPALSAAGALDMVGNVAEWSATRGAGGHYALGGSWADPSYVMADPLVVPSWERRETIGFRCARYPGGEAAEILERPVVFEPLPLDDVPLMSDAAFEQTRRLHAYPRTPLAAVVETSRTLPGGATEQWATLAPASGDERIPVRLRLPAAGVAPFQVVVVVPGADLLWSDHLDGHLYEAWLEFLVAGGRAVVEPVLAGTFQRQGNAPARGAFGSFAALDRLLVRWVHDVGRTLDYVEEREDLDARRIAYLGTSFGAWVSPHLLAYEPRFDAAVLWAGGFTPFESPARVPLRANLMRRITMPVLLLQGRYDYQMPLPYQRAMMRLLGAPDSQKRHRVFEATHWPYPRRELIEETGGWLDRHLGPVERPRG